MRSNNKYIPPASYMSKLEPKYIRKRGGLVSENGIGYYRPSTISPKDFKELYKLWEKKLADSGFEDIEYRNPHQTGTVDAFFRRNGSAATISKSFDAQSEDYYRLARHFLVDFKFSKEFAGRAALMKYLWYLHSEGIPYRKICKIFGGEVPKGDVKRCPPRFIQSVSVFWAHYNMTKILNFFWIYAAKQSEGAITDPRASKKMPFKARGTKPEQAAKRTGKA